MNLSTETSCDLLTFRTTLNSPNPDVVPSLYLKEVLFLIAKGDKGPIEATTKDGLVAGSITSGQMMRLLQCISEGHEYVGIVCESSGGKVEIEVRIKSQ